jgi:hypothetical protein
LSAVVQELASVVIVNNTTHCHYFGALSTNAKVEIVCYLTKSVPAYADLIPEIWSHLKPFAPPPIIAARHEPANAARQEPEAPPAKAPRLEPEPAAAPQAGVVINAIAAPAAPPPVPAPVAPPAPVVHYDIFISLRFGEAMDEAVALKAALQQRGFSVFLCDVPPGVDIARTVISALTHCKLAVILGTLTYGTETPPGFSTFDELRYIKNEKKPFFLVKMCDRFQVEEAKVRLPIDISYFFWQPKSEAEKKRVPSALVEQILQRHAAVVAGGGSGAASGSASPTKLAGAHNPTPAAAASAAGGEDELEAEFISWLAALKLGSDLPKVQQAFLSLGILSKDKLSLAVRKSRVSVERLAAHGVREVSAEAVFDAMEQG